MAQHSLIQPRYYGNADKRPPLMVGGPEFPNYKETASQSWKIGDLIYKDSNGTLAICTNSTGKLNSEIGGQAISAASGVTGQNVYFRAIRPSDVYIMNVYHSTIGSAVTNQNQERVIYGIILANSKWHVDIENTTTEDASTALAKLRVVGFPRTSPADGSLNTIGDTYGFVFVQFIPFTIASDGSPFTRNLQFD